MRIGARAFAELITRPGIAIPLALHVVLAVVLCFIPLFDNLGFERALATALLAATTTPALAVSLVRSHRDAGGADVSLPFAEAVLLGLLSLVPSVLAGFLVEMFTQSCEPESGLYFLALLGGGNVLFGAALGSATAVLTEKRFVPGLIITLSLLAFLFASLLRLYREPQIFLFSLPFGYWPGSLYDEELTVSSALWAFRGYTALVALAIVAAARVFAPSKLLLGVERPRVGAVLLMSALVLTASLAAAAGRDAGFDVDRGSIERALGKKLTTAHFEIYVDPSVDKERLDRMGLDHELRWHQLERFFGTAPAGRIKSFVYADVQQKGRLMGARGTQIARPWAHEIHIHGYDVPHPVLKHELAHVFAGELATGPFRVPARGWVFVNIGVVEGIAVAADWRAQELTIHQWARAMRALNLAPDLRRSLDVAGFWSLASAKAYTAAGSFIRWLADEHGMEKLAVLYRTSDFQEAYGRPLDGLVTDWEAFIDELPLPETDLLVAEHRFKQPGIFQKICAHRAANLAAEGHAKIAGGDLDAGIEMMLGLVPYSPADPAPLLAISDALARAGRNEEAVGYAEKALALEGASERSVAQVKETLGNLAWRRGDLDAARAAYQEVLKLHLSEASDRLQCARIALLDRTPEVQDILRSYLFGELPMMKALVRLGAVSRANPDDALLHYLYGKALEGADMPREGVDEMRAALAGVLPTEAMTSEAQASLGRMLLASGRAEEARYAFESLVAESRSQAQRLNAQDWAERAVFALTGTLLRPE